MDNDQELNKDSETMDTEEINDMINQLAEQRPTKVMHVINIKDFNQNQLAVLDLLMKRQVNQEMMTQIARNDAALYDAYRLWDQGKAKFSILEHKTNTNNLPTPETNLTNSILNDPSTSASQKITEDKLKRKETVDDEGFKFPHPSKTLKKPRTVMSREDITTMNRFGRLDMELNLRDDSVEQPLQPQEPKKSKIKPIHMFRTEDYRQIIDRMKKEIPEAKFQAKNSGLFIKLLPETEDAHRAVTEFMRENKIQGYILPMGIPKLKKVVIRGLPTETDPEDIKKELTKLGYPVNKVAQIISRKRQGQKMPLFQVQLQDTEEGKNIDNLQELFYLRVGIEKYKSPFRFQQCHQCQFFHHHSQYCLMKPRCAKCGDMHNTGNCPHGTGKINEEYLKCANCLDKHPANYAGCTKFPKINPPPS